MDEPLSNLDALLRLEMPAELKRLLTELKVTTLYVTHDQIEALSMGDRIAVMKDGIIQQCDRPTVVYDHPANRFVGSFIGNPPMNFMQGQVQKRADGKVIDGKVIVRIGDFDRIPALQTRQRSRQKMGRRSSWGFAPRTWRSSRSVMRLA